MTDAKFDEIWNNITKPILEHRRLNNKQLYIPVRIEDLQNKVKLRYNSLRIPSFPGLKNSTLIDSYDSYLTQTIKILYYEQMSNNLSILELANIFRLLEQYTDSVYKDL